MKGKKIKAGTGEFSKSIKFEGASSIAVDGQACIACRYEGGLNGIKNAAATAAWPGAGASIDSKRILEIYRWRWRIEAFFQSMKAVGFDSYQEGDMQAIANYWCLSGIFHAACRIVLGAQMNFSEGFEMMHTQSLRECAENIISDIRIGNMEDEETVKLYVAATRLGEALRATRRSSAIPSGARVAPGETRGRLGSRAGERAARHLSAFADDTVI
ncbi:MAG: hypothetical protein LBU32_19975 [Clostridiales bacterium]|nr:hypothetical protein [Clostridiales bacterium]